MEVITYQTLLEKYPEMKLDILRLRHQKNQALIGLVSIFLCIGIGLGYMIHEVI